ncbi:DUF4402 domain-containing protein [Altererythrobacter sp. ZODW24]|uniref:DUF4402 domain-containing protein n=1 Tax=Altererythrobacter sp. ZODW24 TaxID=2185142 RepID=UPI000DF74DEA|nr:DUF4402 domain-containing protein [Altererythrobacter sp. ZODW24]
MFSRLLILAALLPLLCAMPAPVAAQGMCPQCDLPPGCRGQGNNKPKKNIDCTPVSVDIESGLDFGRLVLIGDGVGQVIIDLNTGQKTTVGNINDLGGMAFKGVARISGKANSPVTIILPSSIIMTDAAGGEAQLTELRTDMPLVTYLDGAGQLEFSFTGNLKTDNPIGGNLRGRIPISVQYN